MCYLVHSDRRVCNQQEQLHQIRYDDGDMEILNLDAEEWRLLMSDHMEAAAALPGAGGSPEPQVRFASGLGRPSKCCASCLMRSSCSMLQLVQCVPVHTRQVSIS